MHCFELLSKIFYNMEMDFGLLLFLQIESFGEFQNSASNKQYIWKICTNPQITLKDSQNTLLNNCILGVFFSYSITNPNHAAALN